MGNNTSIATDVQKEAMITALEENYGNVTAAAKAVKISPRTHYRWLKEDGQYADQAESIRDISYRKLRDKLVASALKKIDKGDSSVLNRMMGIYLKNTPEEMRRASTENNVPMRVRIKYIDKLGEPGSYE